VEPFFSFGFRFDERDNPSATVENPGGQALSANAIPQMTDFFKNKTI
jgi:hypothetical protein